MMGTHNPLINHATAFLKLLDPEANRFCFRTFSDRRSASSSHLAGNFQGSLEQVCQPLQDRNDRGAGAFVVINDGGQRAKDIVRVRAVFADTDGAELGPIVSTLTPHIVVNSSPGNWHVYWLLEEGFPLNQFGSVQKAIATKFGTDGNVSDLSRVMRLPGFHHHKADPFPVELQNWDAHVRRYSFTEIINGLELDMGSTIGDTSNTVQSPIRRKSEIYRKVLTGQHSKSEIEKMLTFIDPNCGRKEWMDIIFVLAFELGEDGRELADCWSRGDLFEGNRK